MRFQDGWAQLFIVLTFWVDFCDRETAAQQLPEVIHVFLRGGHVTRKHNYHPRAGVKLQHVLDEIQARVDPRKDYR